MIGPVYPHRTPVNGEQFAHRNNFDRDLPIGIIQLINKDSHARIDEYDIRKFEAIQDLIGLSIDKTSETHATVNIRIGVQERMKNMDDWIEGHVNSEEHYGITSADINGIQEARTEIKTMMKELESIR